MTLDRPIIVIEDDEDDQELLQEIFEELELGGVVRFFNTCQSAFQYLLTTMERPFLIISDINLPAMTGMEFKQAINQHEELRKKCLPFVFLSTSSDENIIAKAFELLVQGYFVKPASLSGLRATISHIIQYWCTSKHPAFG